MILSFFCPPQQRLIRWKLKARSCHKHHGPTELTSLNPSGPLAPPSCIPWCPGSLARRHNSHTVTPAGWEHTLQTAWQTATHVSAWTSCGHCDPSWGWRTPSPAGHHPKRCPGPKPQKWQVCGENTWTYVQLALRYWNVTEDPTQVELLGSNSTNQVGSQVSVMPLSVRPVPEWYRVLWSDILDERSSDLISTDWIHSHSVP